MTSGRYRVLAGASLVSVGSISLLSIVVAGALVPGYSTANQTISALGSVDGNEASRLVFNIGMVVSGLLTLVAGYALHHVYDQRLLTAVVGIAGVGLIGVGTFPTQGAGMAPDQTGFLHFVGAMLAFVGVGASALATAGTVRGTFRYVSLVLGVLELAALVAFVVFGDANPLGVGGIERVVAYLGLAWVTAFGGFLLADEPAVT